MTEQVATSEPQYFVDERGGCIAVRDRWQTDPDYQGLHSDTTGVVRYWHGIMVKGDVCDCCKQVKPGTWQVKPEDREEAERLCRNLNQLAATDFAI